MYLTKNRRAFSMMKLAGAVAVGVMGTLLVTTTIAEPPEMSAEEAKMMEAMVKAATPGAQHAEIMSLQGKWKGVVKSMDPMTGKESVSEGVMTNTSILGGRWLRQEWKGEYMGMPFDGVGYMGYDNVKKQYLGTWMDTFTTGAMFMQGTYSQGDKAYTMNGMMCDPMTGKDMPCRESITIKDNNSHSFEMFVPGPDGKEMSMMTIEYTRIK